MQPNFMPSVAPQREGYLASSCISSSGEHERNFYSFVTSAEAQNKH